MRVMVISTPVFQLGQTGLAGYGGLEQVAWYCAKGLAEKGHEVTLVAPEDSQCPGAHVLSIGKAGTWDERTAFQAYASELGNYQVIIDHSWQKHSYLAKAQGVCPGPILGVCHAPISTMYGTLPPVEKPCFVCISKDQAAHFEAFHGREARVAYNGIDLSHYKAIEGVKRSNRFLFVARFSSIKGADLAIEACKKAGVGLDVLGDTSITNEPEYYAQCKAMADGAQIRIVGSASRGEVVWWMSQAHAFLHPNLRFREPFGLAPIEAQACGLPVVAWKFGAMRETVEDNVTGFLVSSVDEMVKHIKGLSQPNGILEHTRSRCCEWASQFSIDNSVMQYERLIHEAVETGGW